MWLVTITVTVLSDVTYVWQHDLCHSNPNPSSKNRKIRKKIKKKIKIRKKIEKSQVHHF